MLSRTKICLSVAFLVALTIALNRSDSRVKSNKDRRIVFSNFAPKISSSSLKSRSPNDDSEGRGYGMAPVVPAMGFGELGSYGHYQNSYASHGHDSTNSFSILAYLSFATLLASLLVALSNRNGTGLGIGRVDEYEYPGLASIPGINGVENLDFQKAFSLVKNYLQNKMGASDGGIMSPLHQRIDTSVLLDLKKIREQAGIGKKK